MGNLEYLGKGYYKQKYMKICKNCNREFDMFPTDSKEWCYKDNIGYGLHYYCSWNCQMEHERNSRRKIEKLEV